jgi:uncharacterized membrane protein YphA (DoxX/SURF4 family)
MTPKFTMKEAAPIVVRVGLSLVFLWFAWQQFAQVEMWTRLIPASVVEMSGLSAATIVHFNAAFEVVFGLSLLLGFFVRTSALLLALHLLSIVLNLGYNAVAVRDIGLMLAMMAVFLYGMDRWSLDYCLIKRKTGQPI